MSAGSLGIDTSRIYFREDIAKLWGYDYQPSRFDSLPAALRESNLKSEEDRLRKWFQRNFVAKGLRVFKVGGRTVVDGHWLAEWVRHNSGRFEE